MKWALHRSKLAKQPLFIVGFYKSQSNYSECLMYCVVALAIAERSVPPRPVKYNHGF